MKELNRTAKQDKITGGATSITSSNLTASRALVSDGSGKVATSDITGTELNCLDGVSSNIQIQLNNKAAASDLTNHTGDTTKHITAAERTKWNGKQDAITGAATTITASNLTANMVMVTDSTGKVAASSSITTSELSALNNYLVGEKGNIKTRFETVESNVSGIQDQINTINNAVAFLPDYANAKTLDTSLTSFTAPANGFFVFECYGASGVSINVGIVHYTNANQADGHSSVLVPVCKDDIAVKIGGTLAAITFVPYKTN